MDIVNHPGPLLLDPPGNADAYSTHWVNPLSGGEGWTSWGDEAEVHNAITPEPATVALLVLGVLGLAA